MIVALDLLCCALFFKEYEKHYLIDLLYGVGTELYSYICVLNMFLEKIQLFWRDGKLRGFTR